MLLLPTPTHPNTHTHIYMQPPADEMLRQYFPYDDDRVDSDLYNVLQVLLLPTPFCLMDTHAHTHTHTASVFLP